MKKLLYLFLLLLLSKVVMGQDIQPPIDSIACYFNELKIATAKNKHLWNKDLYGPMMLINPETRRVFTNIPDAENELTFENGIYTGYLPEKMGLANSAITWNSITWATVMFPMSPISCDRISIMAHELFHVAQPQLEFIGNNTVCNHLDSKDGRIYLRLELVALIKAIEANSDSERQKHLTNAMTFRAYRHSIFPDAKTSENEQEIIEGLAEYTGEMTCGRNNEERKIHFINRINYFFQDPTFVRSFAYETTPVYGYLLYQNYPKWTLNINKDTQLTDFFISSFKVNIPANIKATVENLLNNYNGRRIIEEEIEREENISKLIAEYKDKFITKPHLIIQLEQMQIFFDPSNILPLEDKGTVYLDLYLVDSWGTLETSSGALLSPDWRSVVISSPTKIEDIIIEGDGWKIELVDGFIIEKDKGGNYCLKRK